MNLLFFGDGWDDTWRRRQQMAWHLARRPEVAHVLYVELPLTLTSLAKFILGRADPDASFAWGRKLGSRRVAMPSGLTLATPVSVTAWRLRAWGDEEPSRGFCPGLVRALTARPTVVIATVPHAYLWLGDCSWEVLCYDCTERFDLMPGLSDARRRFYALADAWLTAKADLVLVQTQTQLQAKRKDNSNTYLVPNAVDTGRFESPVQEPRSLQGLGRPRAGYVGSINDRIDVALVEQVAQLLPEWQFVFVGLVARHAEVQRIFRLPNVHHVPRRPYDEVPAFLSAFDVCLIPHRPNGVAESQSPLKLFDYLAAGKPIVTTGIAGLGDLEHLVSVADDAPAFARGLRVAQRDSHPAQVRARRAAARANSWEARVETVLSAMCACGLRAGNRDGFGNSRQRQHAHDR